MEIEVKEPLSLADGLHEGVVERVEYREVPYKYTDVYIKEKTSEIELKYGAPTSNSTNSKLMSLLAKFTPISKGVKVDPEKVLVGKEVNFMTIIEETEKGKFVRIVDNSIRPKVATENVRT